MVKKVMPRKSGPFGDMDRSVINYVNLFLRINMMI